MFHILIYIILTITEYGNNNIYYCNYAKQLENAGAASICIKDMAGLLTPYGTYDLVKALKETVNTKKKSK